MTIDLGFLSNEVYCELILFQKSKKNHHFDHMFIENHIFVYKYFYEIFLHAF